MSHPGLLGALTRAVRIESSPITWPWFATRDERDPANRLRRAAQAWWWSRPVRPGEWRRLQLGLGGALWPALAALRAVSNLRRSGEHVARAHGVPRWRQLADMLWLANAWNVSPQEYYATQLFAGREPRELLMRHEVALILDRLCQALDVEQGRLDDKARFHAHARAHGLDVPDTYVHLRGDEVRWLDAAGPDAVPPVDLVLKATSLSSGRGFERWRHAGGRWHRRGVALDLAGLLAHGRARAASQPVLVQRLLTNHPDLAPIAADALSTLRLVTLRRPGQPAAPLAAGLRLPGPGQEVDNLSAGGAMAMVHLATGTLEAAFSDRPEAGTWTVHPRTGAPVAGRRVPRWTDAVALAVRAHESVPDLPFVGWDVAVTPDGPVLVEANTIWGGIERLPLASNAFAECALEHLGRTAS